MNLTGLAGVIVVPAVVSSWAVSVDGFRDRPSVSADGAVEVTPA